jgi:hypothetical protein
MPRLNPVKKDSLVTEFLGRSGSTLRGSSTSSRVVSGTAAQIEQIFGTPDKFMEKYQMLQTMYSSFLENPDMLSKSSSSKAVELARATGRMDLGLLTLDAKQRIQQFAAMEVYNLPTVVQRFGMPGRDLPSGNAYRALTQYDVRNPQSHPALATLSSMYFNIDPNKPLIESLSYAMNPLSMTEMTSNANQILPGRTIKSIWAKTCSWANKKNVNS